MNKFSNKSIYRIRNGQRCSGLQLVQGSWIPIHIINHNADHPLYLKIMKRKESFHQSIKWIRDFGFLVEHREKSIVKKIIIKKPETTATTRTSEAEAKMEAATHNTDSFYLSDL